MSDTHKIIAFDAAKRRTGYAYRTDGRWITGTFTPLDTPALTQVVRNACKAGCTRAAIENCYVGSPRNIATVKALQDAQTRIAVACEMAGLEVVLIYPATWQASYNIGGPSRERKQAALAWARRLGAAPYLSEDEADAVCLCDYAMRAAQFESRTRAKKKGVDTQDKV